MIRLALPSRVPLLYAGIFASLLVILQQFQHTTLYFSACSFLFIIIASVAFNVAGGLTRPSGGYIFFYSTLAVIVGLVSKVYFGEPAESNLRRPNITITVYVVGISMMTVSAYLARRFARRRPLLGSILSDANMGLATVGCLLVGTFLTIATYTIDRGQGTAWSALVQVNRFCELTVILSTIDTIRRTGGRTTIGLSGWISSGVLFFIGGVLGYSKESMITPLICWTLAAGTQAIWLTRGQIVALLLGMAFISYYMVPYSQYGRTQTVPSLFGNIAVAERLFTNLPAVRAAYLESERHNIEEGTAGYFKRPAGLLDRLQMISPDDKLIDATELHGPYGYYPILEDFQALVPHVFWPNKPSVLWGNIYAHEAGVDIAEDDLSTGVSFTPTAEAYHLGGWVGIFVLAPVLWFLAFWLFDSLCGDVHNSPWGLLSIIFFAHNAPEGMLGGLIYGMFYFAIAIGFAAITAGYVMPLIGSLLIGHTRHKNIRAVPLQIRTVRRNLGNPSRNPF